MAYVWVTLDGQRNDGAYTEGAVEDESFENDDIEPDVETIVGGRGYD